MSDANSIIITTGLHEPEFRLKSLINSVLPFIKKNLERIIVSCTRETDENVIKFLKKNSFIVSVPKDDSRLGGYLHAIKEAILNVEKLTTQRILYIDFDRLIHWLNEYPDEFIKIVLEAQNTELLHLGRSERAFHSHPETQTHTERIVNFLGSEALNLPKTRDLISVCYSFPVHLADLIVNKRYTTEMGFYVAWPVILWSYAKEKKYIEVEGLEWETPDRFQKEIEESGYDQWLEKFQSAEEWKKRVNLLEDCVLELNQLLKS